MRIPPGHCRQRPRLGPENDFAGSRGVTQVGQNAPAREKAPDTPSSRTRLGDPEIEEGGQGMFADAPALAGYAAPRCENNEAGRFTNRPSGDSRRAFRPSACPVASCGLAARPPVGGRAASAVTGAPPQSEGLLRVRAQVCFHIPAPSPRGRSRTSDPCRKAVQRPFKGAEYPLAHRRVVGNGYSRSAGRATVALESHPPGPCSAASGKRRAIGSTELKHREHRSSFRDWASEETDQPSEVCGGGGGASGRRAAARTSVDSATPDAFSSRADVAQPKGQRHRNRRCSATIRVRRQRQSGWFFVRTQAKGLSQPAIWNGFRYSLANPCASRPRSRKSTTARASWSRGTTWKASSL